MTPDMISKARLNAETGGYTNVEFRLGEIEALPVADNAADAIISNCVINLSPEKPRVYREAYRVLKSGGRLAISDVVALQPMPEEIQNNLALLSSCVAGAALVDDLTAMLREAGFVQIDIHLEEGSRQFIREWAPGSGLEDYVASAKITAIKG
jgi:SAM-dependent methyltransferase